MMRRHRGRRRIGRGNRPHAVGQHLEAGSHHRRAEPRHAQGVLQAHDLDDFFRRQVERGQVLPAVAVDLHVDETRGDPGQALLRSAGLAGVERSHDSNPSAHDLNFDRLVRLVVSGGDEHGSGGQSWMVFLTQAQGKALHWVFPKARFRKPPLYDNRLRGRLPRAKKQRPPP